MKANETGKLIGSDAAVLNEAVSKIQDSLKPMFEIRMAIEKNLEGLQELNSRYEERIRRNSFKFDALLEVNTLKNATEKFAVEIKKNLELREAVLVINQIKEMTMKMSENRINPFVVAPYIPESVRERLKTNKISFADSTGNFMLSIPNTIFIESNNGAKSNPFRKRGRKSDTLQGPASALIIRELLDTNEINLRSIPMLIKRSGGSSSTAYRVIDILKMQNLVSLDTKIITQINWKGILSAWSKDYSFLRSNRYLRFIDPRGRENALQRLAKLPKQNYAVSGSYGARTLTVYAEPMQLLIYSRDPYELSESLSLIPDAENGDIYIAATDFEVAFKNTRRIGGITYAAPTQIAVDLLTGPGRNPEEGKALIDWMEKNEDRWRN